MLRTSQPALVFIFCLIVTNPSLAQAQSEKTESINQQMDQAEQSHAGDGHLTAGQVEKEFPYVSVDAESEFPGMQLDVEQEFAKLQVDAQKEFPQLQVNAQKEFPNS